MQLAFDHPATTAGPSDIRFYIAPDKDDETATPAINGKKPDADGNAKEPPFTLVIDSPPKAEAANREPPFTLVVDEAAEQEREEEQDDFAELFDEERRRSEMLEQKLASAMLLLHETAAERDRWHSQAQRALAMIDSLQRQITTKPMRQIPPRRRFLGLF